MWFALWDNAANLTGSQYLNSTIWPATQRSKQYAGAHMVKVGGIALDIDSDLVNSAVARGDGPSPIRTGRIQFAIIARYS